MFALKSVYSVGRIAAGLSLVVGVLAGRTSGVLGLGAAGEWIARHGLTLGLFVLGFTPIVGLAAAGIAWLRGRQGDTVGWLALVLTAALALLWWQG